MIDEKKIKMLSKMGMRGTFGDTMISICENSPEKIVITSDLANTSGLQRFKKRFPEQFYNVGIAEQSMIGVAAGLSKEGFDVFVTTFANFSTMRSYEQIRLNMGYMNFPIKIIGLASGFAMGMFGNTHYGLEDMALMRSIPNMVIISPADCFELTKALSAISNLSYPVYLRLVGRDNYPIVYKDDYEFKIGKSVILKEGDDVAIVCMGSTVPIVIDVAKILEEKNIFSTVVNMHTLKPIDEDTLNALSTKFKFIVTVEEHSIIGGLGGMVSEFIADKKDRPILKIIGVEDRFEKAGDYAHMMDTFGLTPEKISNKICKWLMGGE